MGFVRVGAKPRVANRRSVTTEEARKSGQRGSLDRSETRQRTAQPSADWAEPEGKQPSALAASQRDNERSPISHCKNTLFI